MPISRRRMAALALGLAGTLAFGAQAQAQSKDKWPTRAVRFIVPFGPGAGADIGARLFAEKLQKIWGQPVVIDNRPGGDSIVAIKAFVSANDDHTFLFSPSGNFAVHPHNYTKMPYDPKDLNPVARVSNTVLGVAVKADSPYKNLKDFTEAVRKAPGKFSSGLVQGITEFTFWGYEHDQKLKIVQAPYRDINAAPVDLAEDRIQVVMASLAIVQPQLKAGRIRLITLNNKTRVPTLPDVPTAREQGFPSLEYEGLVGLFGLPDTPEDRKAKIYADFQKAAADGSIEKRLQSSGQVMNLGSAKEFTDSIQEQFNNVTAIAKAINYKPRM